jgi:hypothetical protein
VVRIERDAIEVAADYSTGHLKALLVTVVASLAQRLVVGWFPEELLVALVRLDVVNHRGCRYLAVLHAHHAKRMAAQVASTVLLPSRTVPALSGGSAVVGHRADVRMKKPAVLSQGGLINAKWLKRFVRTTPPYE